MNRDVHHCAKCGTAVEQKIPEGDNRIRQVCPACHYIHYQNPLPVAGCILTWEGRILLAKRAIEPRYGFWTLPAGFMEIGETATEAAAREAMEETAATAQDLALYGVYSIPHIGQLYIMYRGVCQNGHARAADESLDVDFVLPDEIPWDELAFPVIKHTLRRFLSDSERNQFPVFHEALDYRHRTD